LNLLFFGLPAGTRQALVDLGASNDTILFVTGILMVQDINVAAGTFPDFLNSATETALEQQVGTDLVAFAVRNGGIPLEAGQMVHAQGWIGSGRVRTTFAMEAHFDGSGGLVGKLTLNDHGGFSIQAGPVVQAFLTGSNAFLVNGTYVANDGSAQTWTIAGDATMQSVAISTSEGFSASGILSGGNVMITR
jgi:hypothetical protein